jgi:branched-chain amino acid transport system substrate-binding protein
MTQARLDELGFNGILLPIKTSCADHMGSTGAHLHLGRQGMEDHQRLVRRRPRHRRWRDNESSAKYAAEHKITPRTCQ